MTDKSYGQQVEGFPSSEADTDVDMANTLDQFTAPGPKSSDTQSDADNGRHRHQKTGLEPVPSFVSAIRAVSSDYDKVITVLKGFATCLEAIAEYEESDEDEDVSELQAFEELFRDLDAAWDECQVNCPELEVITTILIRADLSVEIDDIIEYFGDLDESSISTASA